MLRLLRRIFGKKWGGLPVEARSMAPKAKEVWSGGDEPESLITAEKFTPSDPRSSKVSTSFRVGRYGEIIESELASGPEHPRILELRELAKTLGGRDQVCPYCHTSLAKFPQRKTKCKTCGGQIYSRKEPLSGEKRLIREDELELFDELQELSLGTWTWWNEKREAIMATKIQLSSEWGIPASKISDGDAQWRILTRDADDALSKDKLGTYRGIRVEMIRHLIKERRLDQAKGLAPECIYLAYAGYPSEKGQFEKDFEDKMQSRNPKLATRHDQWHKEFSRRVHEPELSLYFSLFITLGEAEQAILSDAQVEAWSKFIPISKQDALSRFAEHWRDYAEALARMSKEGGRVPDVLAQHLPKDST